MLVGLDRLAPQGLALGELGQAALVVVAIAGLVPVLPVEPQEAVEGQHRTGCAQAGGALVDGDIDADLLELRARHLACQSALPDQLVEPPGVGLEHAAQIGRPAGQVGRADRLMGFLGVLGLGLVDPRAVRQVGVAEIVGDGLARGADRFLGNLNAVGPHVGDQADRLALDVDTLVELLSEAHGAARAQSQLARGLLLQGRGGEWREGIALNVLALDLADLKAAGAFQKGFGALGRGLVGQIEALELLAVQDGQPRLEEGARNGLEGDVDGPVFLRPEDLDLGLALADQAQGDRLHSAGRAAPRQLAPKHRREGEADQVIERAPGQVGVDQLAVELARVLEGLDHSRFGDFVEHHALDIDAVQGLAPLKLLGDMPGNRLALPVRVGGQIKPACALDRLGDLLEALFRPRVDRPGHGEALVGQHRAILGR